MALCSLPRLGTSALRCFAPASACHHGPTRLASSSHASDMVQSMLDYVRAGCQGQHNQALDVLKTGLAASTDADKSRLLLAMSEVETDRGNWAEASDRAAEALATGQGSLSSLQLGLASWQHTRALLAQAGRESEASSASDMAIQGGGDQAVIGYGRKMLSGQFLQRSQDPSGAKDAAMSQPGSLAAHSALVDVGLVELAMGNVQAAEATLLGIDSSKADLSGDILSPGSMKEMMADCELARAQLKMVAKDWKTAEAHLSEALALAEGVTSDTHPRVAVPLLLLADCYSRTQRFTLAEGLYRSLGSLLRLTNSAGMVSSSVAAGHPHPWLGAYAAWRYSQMLVINPKRSHEVDDWAAVAESLWPATGLEDPIEAVLGGPEVLKGKAAGTGVLLHLQTQRLLPCTAQA